MSGYEKVAVPPDGNGKALAQRKAVGAGPAGEDLYFAVEVSVPDNEVGARLFSVALQAVPTAQLTVLTSADTAIEQVFLHNSGVSATWVTIQAGDGAQLLGAFVMNPRDVVMMPLAGIKLSGGVKWQAGASGIYGAMKGYQV